MHVLRNFEEADIQSGSTGCAVTAPGRLFRCSNGCLDSLLPQRFLVEESPARALDELLDLDFRVSNDQFRIAIGARRLGARVVPGSPAARTATWLELPRATGR
jgi:hypothetical protein